MTADAVVQHKFPASANKWIPSQLVSCDYHMMHCNILIHIKKSCCSGESGYGMIDSGRSKSAWLYSRGELGGYNPARQPT